MRKLVFNIHLYAALVTGLILIVVSITGCLLVFELKMDAWFDPGASYVHPTGQPLPFTRLLEQVQTVAPGQKITEINPGPPGFSVMARIAGRRVFVNPYTAGIVGVRSGEPPSFHVRHLHRELFAGQAGRQIVNATTFLLLLQSLTGLYLWWPLKRTDVHFSASWRRIQFDLHHAVGFFSSLFICILAVTGLVKTYGDSLQPSFDRITGSPTLTRDVPSKPPAGSPKPINIDNAIAVAAQHLPGAGLARIIPPKDARGSFVVQVKFPGDSTVPGRSWVVVDQYTGDVLALLDARTAPLGSKIPIVNRELHVGSISGVPTRILVFLSGLAILLQTFTGYLMWWRKRSRKPAPQSVFAANLVE
jgi:uncharacterized iron-regulated membrane protein